LSSVRASLKHPSGGQPCGGDVVKHWENCGTEVVAMP
jgi:hypothetical protein